jgi:hypothetical protein
MHSFHLHAWTELLMRNNNGEGKHADSVIGFYTVLPFSAATPADVS